MQSKVEIMDQLEQLAKDYESETGIKVEIWSNQGDDFTQVLKTKLANNQGPTLFSLHAGAESEQLSEYIESLDDLTFADQLVEGLADERAGELIGVPMSLEGFGMVYNKSLFNADEINTVDDFIAMLQEQKENGVYGFELSQESYFLIGHILNTPFALQDDPDAFLEKLNAGEVKMADNEIFQEFAKLYEAIREYSSNPLEVDYDKACGNLATGKAAAIHQGNWMTMAGMLDDYDMDFEIGLAPIPIAGNDKLEVSAAIDWYVNSQKSEEEIQAGKDFLNWLYTSDSGINYLMNEFDFIPVVEGMENDDLDVLSQDIAEFAQAGKTIDWSLNDWPSGIIDAYLAPVAQEFFISDMSGQEFLEKLDAAWVEANQ